ncbi:MAG: bifunctional nuclease family protein [bacterium]|nr:bifunctional nuclease family protein [bacterium]
MDEPSVMIPVRLSRIVIRDKSDHQWIFLTEQEGVRGFPIVIGPSEASEIRRVVTDKQALRPLTHQLALNSIAALGGEVTGVDIVSLRDNTFYARMLLSRDGETVEVDARPSDAVALGLRAGCPIRVAEEVLEEARSDTATDPLPEEDEGDAGEDS